MIGTGDFPHGDAPTAFCSSRHARIHPSARIAAQSRFDRIVLDVTHYAPLFGRTSCATVEIVPAPERAGYFDTRDNSGKITHGADQCMNVIGHHYPTSEFVEAFLLPCI